MKTIFKFLEPYYGKIIFFCILIFAMFIGYNIYFATPTNLEDKLIYLLEKQGYVILFAWSILEGELGLLMAGIMSHDGTMNLYMAIFIGGLGGFVGDQIYFYIGRFNKNYVLKKLKTQRRKFALANLLLKKYGWPIIFAQRYMYGLRTIIPISIGLTRYSSKTFAFINFISAMVWATITIVPAYIFGKELLQLLELIKQYWYIALIAIIFAVLIIIYFVFKKTAK
jgi:membrane protein DedA with SNARE-associated domain